MAGIPITFWFYESIEKLNASIANRRRKFATDPAFVRARTTFTVLQSIAEPKLFGFVIDSQSADATSIDYLAEAMKLRVFARNVMPFYGPFEIVGSQADESGEQSSSRA